MLPTSSCRHPCRSFGGSLVFLLAISDYFNLNLLHFKDHIVPEHASIFMSTLGNINFYAGYGAIILGLAAGLYATWPRTSRTVVYYFLLVLSFVGLIIGNSDNAYLTFGGLLAFFRCIFSETGGGCAGI